MTLMYNSLEQKFSSATQKTTNIVWMYTLRFSIIMHNGIIVFNKIEGGPIGEEEEERLLFTMSIYSHV